MKGNCAKACAPSTITSMLRSRPMRQIFCHREDLPGAIRDVADVDDARLRRDALLDHVREIVHARRRHGEFQLLQDDPVAALALLPAGDHSRVILIRGDHFVAALQFHPQLHDFERLAGIARDRDLLRIAAELPGQPAAHRLDSGIEHVPHVVGRAQILHVEIALLGVADDPRRRRYAAVIEVDHVSIDREGVADVHPEIFVARYRVGGTSRDLLGGGLRPGHGVALQHGEGASRWRRRSCVGPCHRLGRSRAPGQSGVAVSWR